MFIYKIFQLVFHKFTKLLWHVFLIVRSRLSFSFFILFLNGSCIQVQNSDKWMKNIICCDLLEFYKCVLCSNIFFVRQGWRWGAWILRLQSTDMSENGVQFCLELKSLSIKKCSEWPFLKDPHKNLGFLIRISDIYMVSIYF